MRPFWNQPVTLAIAMNKLLFWVLAAVSLLLLCAMVYALVYAPPGSGWKKNSVVVGMGFITVTRFAIMAYRRMHPVRS